MLIPTCCPEERWKSTAIVGCPDYEASSCGRVRRKDTGRILIPNIRKKGYLGVRLKPSSGKKVRITIHKLVLLLFIGPKPSEKHQCAHNDGRPSNNHKTNLRWATALENIRDKYKHGTMGIGSKNGRAKLTEEEVILLRREYRFLMDGLRSYLREKYGVKPSMLESIVLGNSWKHILDK